MMPAGGSCEEKGWSPKVGTSPHPHTHLASAEGAASGPVSAGALCPSWQLQEGPRVSDGRPELWDSISTMQLFLNSWSEASEPGPVRPPPQALLSRCCGRELLWALRLLSFVSLHASRGCVTRCALLEQGPLHPVGAAAQGASCRLISASACSSSEQTAHALPLPAQLRRSCQLFAHHLGFPFDPLI